MNNFNKIRVLIVDDSLFTRKFLREILNSDPEIEVVGEASDGLEAVEKSLRLNPDVITMDYEMPNMNGAQASRIILARDGNPPAILMISSYTKEGAKETWESLRAGAVDFMEKPAGEMGMNLKEIRSEILLKIKAIAEARIVKYRDLDLKDAKQEKKSIDGANLKIVVIGASTGGPPVLENIFSDLPQEIRAAFLVVQHMPKVFTKSFAERLNKVSLLEIKEAEEGDVIKQGSVFVAPGDFHMVVETRKNRTDPKTIHLTVGIPEHGLRPAIDVTMASAAAIFGDAVIGIILTGMGEDGKIGIQSIKDAGGYAIVQDPETAVLDFMPKAVIRAGLADEILSPKKIVERIIELTS